MRVAWNKTNPEHCQKMIADYQAGKSAKESASQFGYDLTTCLRVLRRAGIQPRSFSEAYRTHLRIPKRKYHLDETFFDNIDSEEKSYWLGFLMADGCVGREPLSGTPTGVRLVLQLQDQDHLRKLQESLKSDYPISNRHCRRKRPNHRAITFNSQHLANALCKHGVVPAKSRIAAPPQIQDDLQRHFWRGMVDGDGCLYKGKNGNWEISLAGSLEIVQGFHSFLLSRGVQSSAHVRSPVRVRTSGSAWMFRVGGNRLAKQIGKILWDDCSIYLDRKWKKYLQIKEVSIKKIVGGNYYGYTTN